MLGFFDWFWYPTKRWWEKVLKLLLWVCVGWWVALIVSAVMVVVMVMWEFIVEPCVGIWGKL